MLRHFYLIILLLCIEWTVSYNYIDDVSGRSFHNVGRHIKKSKKIGRNKNRDNLILQEYNYDRMPVEFDVASFIQPDEEAIEEDDASRNLNKKRRRISSNDYGSFMGLHMDDANKKKEKGQDYFNMGGGKLPELNLNQPLLKDPINTKHLSLNSLDDLNGKYNHEKYRNLYGNDVVLSEQHPKHNPGKKSAFKRMKIPFFSHDKSGTLETKKTKKRKLFCFNCPKKEAVRNPDLNRTHEDSMLPNPIYKMKRSYEERLCPACRKKFIAILKPNDRLKKAPSKIIHNSRQFQKNVHAKLKEDLKKIRKFSFDDSEEIAEGGYRKKRESEQNAERQLKELDEVQRKVDSVPVEIPKFEMSNPAL